MKNFTLLLSAALLMGASASAAGLFQNSVNPLIQAKTLKVENTQKTTPYSLKNTMRQVDLSKMAAASQSQFRSRGIGDIIYEAEGEAKQYMCNTLGWENSMFGLSIGEVQNLTEIVWGEDGDVYIKNIIDLGFDTYVKGTYADGKIRVDLPQSIYYDLGFDDYGNVEWITDYYLNICRLETYTDEKDGEEVTYIDYVEGDPAENYFVYSVDENGVINLELSDWEYNDDLYQDFTLLPEVIIGLMMDDTDYGKGWTGFGNMKQMFTIFDKEITEVPEGVEIERWVMTYTDINDEPANMFINVAVDGKHIYLSGFDEFLEGWAKGIINDDTVSFPSEQFLGFPELYGVPIYFMTAHLHEEEIEIDGETFPDLVAEFTNGILFKYDAENKRLEVFDNSSIVLNASLDRLYALDLYMEPTIYKQTPEMTDASPVTPEFVYMLPWSEEYYGGMGEIVWDIPNENVKGALLDTDRMYYHILFDGEVYPLSPDEWPAVEEEIWDIPYYYTDDYDIFTSGSLHYLWFYLSDAESYGCQSFYVAEDGTTYASEIATYVDGQTGINGVKEFSKVVSTTYYDMSGRAVANPQPGLYIKSMKLENGKVQNVKVSIK